MMQTTQPSPTVEPTVHKSGAQTIESQRRQTINTFKAIAKLRPPMDQEFSVISYALIDDPKKEKIAMYIPLGNYPTRERALERVNFIIESTGHRSVFVMKTCRWQELSTQYQPDRVEFVQTDQDGKLVKLHNEQLEQEKQEFEKRKRVEEEMMKEQDARNDPSSLDHYIHNWFVAIRNRTAFLEYQKNAQSAYDNYQKRVVAIRDQYAKQPEFEAQWLAEVKRKLADRHESHIYDILEAVSKEIHDEVLQPKIEVHRELPEESPRKLPEESIKESPHDEALPASPRDEVEDGLSSDDHEDKPNDKSNETPNKLHEAPDVKDTSNSALQKSTSEIINPHSDQDKHTNKPEECEQNEVCMDDKCKTDVDHQQNSSTPKPESPKTKSVQFLLEPVNTQDGSKDSSEKLRSGNSFPNSEKTDTPISESSKLNSDQQMSNVAFIPDDILKELKDRYQALRPELLKSHFGKWIVLTSNGETHFFNNSASATKWRFNNGNKSDTIARLIGLEDAGPLNLGVPASEGPNSEKLVSSSSTQQTPNVGINISSKNRKRKEKRRGLSTENQ